MAIDAKMSFLRAVEKQCADKLTVKDSGALMCLISDILESYEMMENRRSWDEDGPDDMLDAFVAGLQVQGRSPKTIDRYVYIVQRFLKATQIHTRRVTVYHIRKWLAGEKERGLAESSLEGFRQVLSSYFGWLYREKLIEDNPMVNIGPIKVPKKKKLTFSDVDMEKLYSACTKLRDRVIIRFLARTGCRVSEVIQLNRKDINLKDQQCVVHGKGDKERVVFFDAVTAIMLEQYLKSRRDKMEALFIGQRNERLLPGGIRQMLKKVGKASGVEQVVHPHKFRRTLATEMARNGMPIQQVSSLLGHEKIDTTMRYVVQDSEDIKQSYRRFA